MNAFRVLLALMAGLAGAILVLPLLLLIAPFLLVLILTRHRQMDRACIHALDQIVEFDPFIGWKGKATLNTYHLADDVYRLTTDSDGWRGRRSYRRAIWLYSGIPSFSVTRSVIAIFLRT